MIYAEEARFNEPSKSPPVIFSAFTASVIGFDNSVEDSDPKLDEDELEDEEEDGLEESSSEESSDTKVDKSTSSKRLVPYIRNLSYPSSYKLILL